MTIGRRALLTGAAAAGLGALTGCSSEGAKSAEPGPRARRSSAGPARSGAVVSGSFASRARGRQVGWSIAYPPGSATDAALPVALVLHGRGDDHRAAFGSHDLDRFLAIVVRAGSPPFALAAVDGGDHTYWHARADGDDPQRMVLDEFLPLLADRGLRTARVGLSGWSMGGYGALLLAERLGPRRCAAVAVDSPALWLRPEDTAPGAFDDRADFEQHDVFAGRTRLAGIPLRVAIGTSDPFYAATRAFVTALPHRPATDFAAGGHDVAFWRRSAPAQLRFLARWLHGG